jgi:hypothetical protein
MPYKIFKKRQIEEEDEEEDVSSYSITLRTRDYSVTTE